MKLERDMLILGGVAFALVAFYIYKKGAGNIGQSLGAGAVNAVGGVVTGAWQATTNAVGVPNADTDKCAAARAAGNTWDAFVYCKPGEFFPYLFGSSGSSSGQCTDCANNAATTTPYDYGTGTPGVPAAPSATDPGYQMTDYANLGNLKF